MPYQSVKDLFGIRNTIAAELRAADAKAGRTHTFGEYAKMVSKDPRWVAAQKEYYAYKESQEAAAPAKKAVPKKAAAKKAAPKKAAASAAKKH